MLINNLSVEKTLKKIKLINENANKQTISLKELNEIIIKTRENLINQVELIEEVKSQTKKYAKKIIPKDYIKNK